MAEHLQGPLTQRQAGKIQEAVDHPEDCRFTAEERSDQLIKYDADGDGVLGFSDRAKGGLLRDKPKYGEEVELSLDEYDRRLRALPRHRSR